MKAANKSHIQIRQRNVTRLVAHHKRMYATAML